MKNLINNIKSSTSSEYLLKMIKYKKHTPGQRELLNLLNDLLDTILTDKTLESESQEDKNENENENDETLMSSKDENKNAKNKKTVPIPKKMRMKTCC